MNKLITKGLRTVEARQQIKYNYKIFSSYFVLQVWKIILKSFYGVSSLFMLEVGFKCILMFKITSLILVLGVF